MLMSILSRTQIINYIINPQMHHHSNIVLHPIGEGYAGHIQQCTLVNRRLSYQSCCGSCGVRIGTSNWLKKKRVMRSLHNRNKDQIFLRLRTKYVLVQIYQTICQTQGYGYQQCEQVRPDLTVQREYFNVLYVQEVVTRSKILNRTILSN